MNLRKLNQKTQQNKQIADQRLHIVLTENTWLDREILSYTSVGWGNGYVNIPKTHPCYGVEYDVLNQDIDVHGGLTYSEETSDGYWRVGFDTAHLGDSLENWPKEAVHEEAERLLKQLKNLE